MPSCSSAACLKQHWTSLPGRVTRDLIIIVRRASQAVKQSYQEALVFRKFVSILISMTILISSRAVSEIKYVKGASNL